jgi:UDP-N-acetylglucosamine acyltransferase
MPEIHPTAVVDSGAAIADDVTVGAYAIVEADVTIGPGCGIGPYARIRRHTTMGTGNTVDSYASIGGPPQDLQFDPATETHVVIGDKNTFREGVTISRATTAGQATVIGSNTYWMANAHAGHDVTVDDGVILTNGAMIGGHAHVGRQCVLGGGSAVHQFCRLGERAMLQGVSAVSMHVPPFCINGGPNTIVGLNRVGIKRAPDISHKEERQIKEAFTLLYRQGLSPTAALAEMDAHDDWGPAARRFADFVRQAIEAEPPYQRGICPMGARGRHQAGKVQA